MKKGLFNVMMANIVCLVISLLTNFLLPRFLSVETYAQIKEYALYISYAGFFSLGYNDGMYLKYGGQSISAINKDDLGSNIKSYCVLQILMFVIIMMVGFFLRNDLIVAFSFGMLSNNILGYLKSLYQATGEFSSYSNALNMEKIVVFIANMILIFLLKSDVYYFYVWSQVVSGIFISIYLITRLINKTNLFHYGGVRMSEFISNIKDGIILMLGNFSTSLFTGLDRWFVKILLGTTNFAMYSFAVSMENLLNVFITPVTVSMYNYFCIHKEKEKIKEIKNYVLVWGFIVIAAAFPAKWILEHFIPKYINAANIIFMLFAAQAFYTVIKGIYVNLYKAEKCQNKYLKQMLLMLVLGFILNTLFYVVLKSNVGIAFATLTTSIIWFCICEIEYKEFRYKSNEIVAIVIMLTAFLITGYKCNAIVGCIIYCIVGVSVGFIFMRNTFNQLSSLIFDIIKKFINNRI